jgi:hypothetical protein
MDALDEMQAESSQPARQTQLNHSPEMPRRPDKARVQEIIANSKKVFRERLAKSARERSKKRSAEMAEWRL